MDRTLALLGVVTAAIVTIAPLDATVQTAAAGVAVLASA
jgi:hypothetical protein